jgi:hypothetical protein
MPELAPVINATEPSRRSGEGGWSIATEAGPEGGRHHGGTLDDRPSPNFSDGSTGRNTPNDTALSPGVP